MEANICTSFKDKIYRIIWASEYRGGISIGFFGEKSIHISYHKDGKNHFKVKGEKTPILQHKTIPLDEIEKFNQIYFQAIPLSKINLKILGLEYKKSINSDVTIFLNENTFRHKGQISISTFILTNTSEKEFTDFVFKHSIGNTFHLIDFFTFKLDFFKDKKLGIVFYSEKEIK